MRVYYDRDADVNLIKGKKVLVVGYGSQGHAHAMNLRDSGVKDVRIALKAGSATIRKAEGAGFTVMSPADGAKWADIVMVLTPDELQSDIYNADLAPNMRPGSALAFAHGLNVHFNLITPRADIDVFMIAPKGPGHTVRSEYLRGGGVPCLVAVAQNASGQVFDQVTIRPKAQASVPGDGAAVGLVAASDVSPILDVECRTYGEYAGDMTMSVDPPRKWWQAGPGEGCIGFTESKITKVLARGNRQVPEVAYAVCDRIGLAPKDIGLLVTNQPNRVFLRNWREALELPESKHRDTFDECGNLFAAGVPVNLDRAITDGQVGEGDVVMMAAFAHAGDFAGAAAVRWGGQR